MANSIRANCIPVERNVQLIASSVVSGPAVRYDCHRILECSSTTPSYYKLEYLNTVEYRKFGTPNPGSPDNSATPLQIEKAPRVAPFENDTEKDIISGADIIAAVIVPKNARK
ncbi:hypothetical protein TNCV_1105741 [Trichonephila clavipes]|nr:hypothetical protein TNCV_1105741 [Trichonephila clavipes]